MTSARSGGFANSLLGRADKQQEEHDWQYGALHAVNKISSRQACGGVEDLRWGHVFRCQAEGLHAGMARQGS